MVCFGCWRPGPGLCPACERSLAPAPARMVGSTLAVRSAYVHAGLAQRLIHDLKYRGLVARVAAFAPAMAAILPDGATVVSPVPRSIVRRLQVGIDPGLELALAVGGITGLPVGRALVPPLWQPRHAGKGRNRRAPVRFVARRPAQPGTVIVDDVVTTGATLTAAARSLGPGVIGAVTATGAGV